MEALTPATQNTAAGMVRHPAHAAEGDIDALALSSNPYVSGGSLTGLSSNPTMLVRYHVARHRRTPPDVLATLSDDVRDVRIALASNPATPPVILDALLGDASEYVRIQVASNPALGEEKMRLIMAGYPAAAMRRALAANEAAPADLLDVLAGDPDTSTRQAVAENANSPAAVLEHLTGDPSVDVVAAVAGNAAVDPELLANHHEWSTGPEVLCRLAENPSCPPHVLESMERGSYDLSFELAANPSSPTTVLDRIVRNPDMPARLHCIENPSVSAETLAEIARERSDTMGRQLAAGHHNTPQATLVALADDPEERVRLCLAENASTPPGVLASLALDGSEMVRSAVARNPTTSSDVLDALAGDLSNYVRFHVAANPLIGEATARRLAADADQTMRYAVLGASPYAERIISDTRGGMSF